MANKTTSKAKSAKTATSTKSTAAKTERAEAPVTKEPVKKVAIPKDVDINQLITVYNGFDGILVYKSPRTGEIFTWDAMGDVQDLELRELRSAKSSAKSFFSQNWFMFDEDNQWVIDYLGVRKYYQNALGIDDFDGLFDRPISELTAIIAGLSDGQRKSVGYRARQMVLDGEIDSRKTIAALEEALGIELEMK